MCVPPPKHRENYTIGLAVLKNKLCVSTQRKKHISMCVDAREKRERLLLLTILYAAKNIYSFLASTGLPRSTAVELAVVAAAASEPPCKASKAATSVLGARNILTFRIKTFCKG